MLVQSLWVCSAGRLQSLADEAGLLLHVLEEQGEQQVLYGGLHGHLGQGQVFPSWTSATWEVTYQ